MFGPPGDWQRKEGCHQVLEGGQGQNGGFRAWAREEIRASNGNVPVLARDYFNLAVPHVPGQASNASKLEILAE
jgi:hypothetical protein